MCLKTMSFLRVVGKLVDGSETNPKVRFTIAIVLLLLAATKRTPFRPYLHNCGENPRAPKNPRAPLFYPTSRGVTMCHSNDKNIYVVDEFLDDLNIKNFLACHLLE